MEIKEILNLENGIYSDKENSVIVYRQVGCGFTIKHIQGDNKPLWCVDYDENGNIECEYPEYK